MDVRALGLALSSWIAIGCAATPSSPVADVRSSELEFIKLDGMSAEVWAFERVVTGRASPLCASVEIERTSSRGNAIRATADHLGNEFRVVMPLREGENHVRARCSLPDGRIVPSQVIRLNVRLFERPNARLRALPSSEWLAFDLSGSEPSSASLSPLVHARFRTSPRNPERLETVDGTPLSSVMSMRANVRRPTHDGEYTAYAELTDASGRSDIVAVRFVVERGELRVIDPTIEHARWIDGAVIYGAVPSLFGQPGLPAIEERLDELARLGIDTIWLSPITESPEGDYGYAIIDYFEVDREHGTRADLHALVRRAHELDMRVIMDVVPSHSSDRHPYFRHAEEHGRRSPYWSFYARDASGAAQHDFDWTHLPKLDFDHPEVRRWMSAALEFWVREFDIDGFRVDAAWSIQHRAPEFLAELARELYSMNPNLLLIAEARACDPFWKVAGFAAGYDWTSTIGRWAWHEPLRVDEPMAMVDVPALRSAIRASDSDRCARVVRFLDNNDTGARFITRRGQRLHDAALTLLFTLPGLPALFTGGEQGAEYLPYEQEEPLEWDESPTHARAIAERIALRRAFEALHEGALTILEVSPADEVLAFVRHGPTDATPPVLVIIDLSGDHQRARVSLPTGPLESFLHRPLYDAMNDEELAPANGRSRSLTISLSPYQARVISALRLGS